jgi:hypothetical protein
MLACERATERQSARKKERDKAREKYSETEDKRESQHQIESVCVVLLVQVIARKLEGVTQSISAIRHPDFWTTDKVCFLHFQATLIYVFQKITFDMIICSGKTNWKP